MKDKQCTQEDQYEKLLNSVQLDKTDLYTLKLQNARNLFCSHRLTASFGYRYPVRTEHGWIWGRHTLPASYSTLANNAQVPCVGLRNLSAVCQGTIPSKAALRRRSPPGRTGPRISRPPEHRWSWEVCINQALSFFPSNFFLFLADF